METRETAVTGGTETILVVEDEAAVRELIRLLLADFGYGVIEAGNGEEALAAARRISGRIDLVLADDRLPGMGGRELLRQLRIVHPEAKTLLVSGGNLNLSETELQEPGMEFLPKPFTAASLAQTVRRIFDAGPEQALGHAAP